MRLALIISFAICLLVGADPVLGLVLTNAYIASERLVVTISPTEARFAGTFIFNVPGEIPKWKRITPIAVITVPVWFPETNEENPNVATFWRVLGRGRGLSLPFYGTWRYGLPGLSDVYNETIGLKVSVGKIPIEIGGFYTTPPEMDTPGRESYGFYLWREVQEQGFSILRFPASIIPQPLTMAPVRISYRQPLLNADGKRRFFYAPVLRNLPAGVMSTDTNVYSITLEATPECELAITYGSQYYNVGSGGSLTLAPKHFQAIRATVTPRSNQRMQ